MIKKIEMSCPICQIPSSVLFDRDKHRSYYQCGSCDLVFVTREVLLSVVDEKSRYEFHQNQESDAGYKNYLKEIVTSISPYLTAGPGLDFGCGRTNLLSHIFKEVGLEVDSYDLYFHPDQTIWSKKYQFIILSEVIEHLREPLDTMKKLRQLLTDEGKIFIKTKFYPIERESFANWFYKRDLTHVQFFNPKSMDYLGKVIGLNHFRVLKGKDLYLLGHHGT